MTIHADISWWGLVVSCIRFCVTRVFPPLFAVAVLVIVGAQLKATSAMRSSLDAILKQGVIKAKPQEAVSEWDSLPGIHSRIVTTREPLESEAAYAVRHAEAVRALSESFTINIEEN